VIAQSLNPAPQPMPMPPMPPLPATPPAPTLTPAYTSAQRDRDNPRQSNRAATLAAYKARAERLADDGKARTMRAHRAAWAALPLSAPDFAAAQDAAKKATATGELAIAPVGGVSGWIMFDELDSFLAGVRGENVNDLAHTYAVDMVRNRMGLTIPRWPAPGETPADQTITATTESGKAAKFLTAGHRESVSVWHTRALRFSYWSAVTFFLSILAIECKRRDGITVNRVESMIAAKALLTDMRKAATMSYRANADMFVALHMPPYQTPSERRAKAVAKGIEA
jgi:hypothetical protein